MNDTDAVVKLLERSENWHNGLEELRARLALGGEQAKIAAESYANRFEGRRSEMVFDVVVSRRRNYTKRVTKLVADFGRIPAARSLVDLATIGVDDFAGLTRTEPTTIRNVAAGLVRFGEENGFDDEDACCRAWAVSVAPIEHVHGLDRYVGQVSGIGPALFAYLRMRAGADTIKPDSRVRNGLQHAGFSTPSGEAELLVFASAIARSLNVSRLLLDQLLWNDVPSR